MSTETTVTTETPDSLALAKDAINYVLGRIRNDADIRYHMGAFTEAFDRLATAHSALTGISKAAIERDILYPQLSRKANAQLIDEIKDALDSSDGSEPAGTCSRIARILGR
jgi:hypothetical protein